MMRIVYSPGKSSSSRPGIFIDRDGVINCRRAGDYVLEWPQFEFMRGIREALRKLSSLKLPMIVISNQAAIGKGLLKPDVLQQISDQMHQALLDDGTVLAAIYYCTHKPDENCACRKPKPTLLLAAAADFHIDLNRSIFIGDADTDVQAARAAGCQPVLLGSGLSSSSDSPDWAMGLPVARTTAELFEVSVSVLKAAGQVESGDSCRS
jgi:D-glycero-D-manno-heptose 1,7-bisphosphate phosphatase